MNVSQIISAAYRKIGVVGHGQTATAEQTEAGAEAFNLMIQGWRLDGIDFWLAPTVDPLATLDNYDLTEEAPIPGAFLEGTVYSLAARLAPEYAVQVQFDERQFMGRMRAALVKVPTCAPDGALNRGAVYPRWRL